MAEAAPAPIKVQVKKAIAISLFMLVSRCDGSSF